MKDRKQMLRLSLTHAMGALERHLSPALCTAFECFFEDIESITLSHGGTVDQVKENIADVLRSMVAERSEPPAQLTPGVAL
jgi:hypothetical protein